MNYEKILKGLLIKDYVNIANQMRLLLPQYGIVTDEDAMRFIANSCNESGCFRSYIEVLYYTTPERLKTTFKRAFDPIKYPKTAKYRVEDYLRNEEKLANLVYDDRIFTWLGLGNFYPGDGYKFRGRGYVQVTGRHLYTEISKDIGIDFVNNPDLLASEQYRLISALWYWKRNKLSSKKSLLETRQVIAGNYTNNPFGYDTVLNYYNKIKFLNV